MKVDTMVIVESEFTYTEYLTDRDGARLLYQLLKHLPFTMRFRSTFGATLEPETMRPEPSAPSEAP